MAQQLFEVERGLSLDGRVSLITGAGAPVGVGDSAEAGIGSQYFDYISGEAYAKVAAGAGPDKWLLAGDKMPLAKQIDMVGSVIYKGLAPVGSLLSDPVWRIQRITLSGGDVSVQWAVQGGEASSAFAFVWSDHANLEYL